MWGVCGGNVTFDMEINFDFEINFYLFEILFLKF
jgi:hypothetical protein